MKEPKYMMMREQLSKSACEAPGAYEVIGSFIDMGMVGFCFGIGLILAVNNEL